MKDYMGKKESKKHEKKESVKVEKKEKAMAKKKVVVKKSVKKRM